MGRGRMPERVRRWFANGTDYGARRWRWRGDRGWDRCNYFARQTLTDPQCAISTTPRVRRLSPRWPVGSSSARNAQAHSVAHPPHRGPRKRPGYIPKPTPPLPHGNARRPLLLLWVTRHGSQLAMRPSSLPVWNTYPRTTTSRLSWRRFSIGAISAAIPSTPMVGCASAAIGKTTSTAKANARTRSRRFIFGSLSSRSARVREGRLNV
jgi:hypothetical protein